MKLLSLARYRVARVDEKSGSRAAALQIATLQYYAVHSNEVEEMGNQDLSAGQRIR